MNRKVNSNYVRMHRKNCGLSQREVAVLLGYRSPWQVSRHEGGSLPSLSIALAYESLFRVPVAAIFAGAHTTISRRIEKEVTAHRASLQRKFAGAHQPRMVAQQLAWLESRTS